MIREFFNKFRKPVVTQDKKPEKPDRPRQFNAANFGLPEDLATKIETALERNFKDGVHPELQKTLDSAKNQAQPGYAMDNSLSVKGALWGNNSGIDQRQLLWYADQTFMGYQICAMLAQQWLVTKCCLMPAQDATRNGYDVTVNDGQEIAPEILDCMRKLDVKYNLNKNLIQLVYMGRIFGIRIAKFIVESDDPDYYFKPFNPDGVKPGSYKGISQIDPYWIAPQLDPESAGDPGSIHFYEPTWWNIAGKLVHRTHLVIFKTDEVADILKPAYVYGGIPIPQKIVYRVYAAERIANEAPMLALTKRTDVLKVDLPQAGAEEPHFIRRIQQFVLNRDNYGLKIIGLEEEIERMDTSLADLDAAIMTQYQLVAAAANVPATKLLGTSPKGFNASGTYEEAAYHEELESIQSHGLTPLIERHHLLLIRSEIMPKFNVALFETTVTWKPLDAMTAKEQAELNKFKADTGAVLMQSGAIDGQDERQRIITDPDSGYTGLEEDIDETTETFLSNPETAPS